MVLRLRVFTVSSSPTLGLGLTLSDTLTPVSLDFFKVGIIGCLSTAGRKTWVALYYSHAYTGLSTWQSVVQRNAVNFFLSVHRLPAPWESPSHPPFFSHVVNLRPLYPWDNTLQHPTHPTTTVVLNPRGNETGLAKPRDMVVEALLLVIEQHLPVPVKE